MFDKPRTREAILAQVDGSIRLAVEVADSAWPRPPHELTPAEIRALYRTPPVPPRPADMDVADLEIPARDAVLRARRYRMSNAARPGALVVYFHGGSFTTGNLDSHDAICCRVAARLDAMVIAVDYRMMPEVRFPVPFEDACEAMRWVRASAGALGAGGAPLCAFGDSAGANLAIAAALALRGEVHLQALWLAYPIVGVDFETPSHIALADAPGLTRARCMRIMRDYLGSGTERADWRAAPLLADDFRGLPFTAILNAEFDPLRSDGELLGARLAAQGVAQRVFLARGMVHGFIKFAPVSPPAAEPVDASLNAIAVALGLRGANQGERV